jgi:hypothetical protein
MHPLPQPLSPEYREEGSTADRRCVAVMELFYFDSDEISRRVGIFSSR